MSNPLPAFPGAVLYSRQGCSPCFAMQREAKRAARRTGISLHVIEIGGDAGHEERYGSKVPVLVLPGGETLRGRLNPGDVEGAFRRSANVLSGPSHISRSSARTTLRRTGLMGILTTLLGWRGRPQA